MQAAGGTAIARSAKPLALGAVLIGAAGFGLDFATKQWALGNLDPSAPVQVIPGQLYLRLIRNPGAAFSMGESFTVVLTCLAIAAMGFLLIWMVPRVRHVGWMLAAGLLLAGVSGNLNDRLTREPGPFHGHVIDFLQVPWFAVFNVADIWITFAAITVIWLTMITQVNLAGEPVPRPDKKGSEKTASEKARSSELVEGPDSPAS